MTIDSDFISEVVVYDVEKYGDKLEDFLRNTYLINSQFDERLAPITQKKIEDVLLHYNTAYDNKQHLLFLSLVDKNKILLPYAFEPFNADDADASSKVSAECIDLIINTNDGLLEYKFNTFTDNRLMASFVMACCDIRYLRYSIGKIKSGEIKIEH